MKPKNLEKEFGCVQKQIVSQWQHHLSPFCSLVNLGSLLIDCLLIHVYTCKFNTSLHSNTWFEVFFSCFSFALLSPVWLNLFCIIQSLWHDRQVETQRAADRLRHCSCLPGSDSLPITDLIQTCTPTPKQVSVHTWLLLHVCITAPVGVFSNYSHKTYLDMQIWALPWTLYINPNRTLNLSLESKVIL